VPEAQFQPGERIIHAEFGQDVVLDKVREGYLRAFFGSGEHRVPVASLRRQLLRTERILTALMVVPAGLVNNWHRELNEMFLRGSLVQSGAPGSLPYRRGSG